MCSATRQVERELLPLRERDRAFFFVFVALVCFSVGVDYYPSLSLSSSAKSWTPRLRSTARAAAPLKLKPSETISVWFTEGSRETSLPCYICYSLCICVDHSIRVEKRVWSFRFFLLYGSFFFLLQSFECNMFIWSVLWRENIIWLLERLRNSLSSMTQVLGRVHVSKARTGNAAHLTAPVAEFLSRARARWDTQGSNFIGGLENVRSVVIPIFVLEQWNIVRFRRFGKVRVFWWKLTWFL